MGAVCSTVQAIAESVGLNEEDVKNALNTLLEYAAMAAAKLASAVGGFSMNKLIAVVFPLPEVYETFQQWGLSSLVDEVIAKLNQACELASKGVAELFINALRAITMVDAIKILQDGGTAATQFMRRMTTNGLWDTFGPVIRNCVDSLGVRELWEQAMTAYNAIPLVRDVEVDIDKMVIEKGINGVFWLMSDFETKARSNPDTMGLPADVVNILKQALNGGGAGDMGNLGGMAAGLLGAGGLAAFAGAGAGGAGTGQPAASPAQARPAGYGSPPPQPAPASYPPAPAAYSGLPAGYGDLPAQPPAPAQAAYSGLPAGYGDAPAAAPANNGLPAGYGEQTRDAAAQPPAPAPAPAPASAPAPAPAPAPAAYSGLPAGYGDVPAEPLAPAPVPAASAEEQLFDHLQGKSGVPEGQISWVEFSQMTSSVGWDQAVAQQMWYDTDRDQSGALGREEFLGFARQPGVHSHIVNMAATLPTPAPVPVPVPVPELSPEEKLFNHMQGKSGVPEGQVSWVEFSQMTTSVGWDQTVAQQMWYSTDIDRSGALGKDEFLGFARQPGVSPYIANMASSLP